VQQDLNHITLATFAGTAATTALHVRSQLVCQEPHWWKRSAINCWIYK